MKYFFCFVVFAFLFCGLLFQKYERANQSLVSLNVEALSSIESQYSGAAYKVEETTSDFYRYDTTCVNNKIKVYKVYLVTTITSCVGQGDVTCTPDFQTKEVKEEI